MSTNSLIPTSTVTSSSSTSTSSSSDGDSASDIFSSAGSPPLIVAFLAIGLFVAAMVGVFGWRRIMYPRGLVSQPSIPRRRKSITLGKRPVLWDVWADLNLSEMPLVEATRWENITPMTAILTFLIPPVPIDPPATVLVNPAPTPLQMLRCLVSAVKRFYSGHPPPPPPPLASLSDDKAVGLAASPPPEGLDWGDASSLQASVIIAMPTQVRSVTSGKDPDPEQTTLGELGEFCIGMMEVPWSEAG